MHTMMKRYASLLLGGLALLLACSTTQAQPTLGLITPHFSFLSPWEDWIDNTALGAEHQLTCTTQLLVYAKQAGCLTLTLRTAYQPDSIILQHYYSAEINHIYINHCNFTDSFGCTSYYHIIGCGRTLRLQTSTPVTAFFSNIAGAYTSYNIIASEKQRKWIVRDVISDVADSNNANRTLHVSCDVAGATLSCTENLTKPVWFSLDCDSPGLSQYRVSIPRETSGKIGTWCSRVWAEYTSQVPMLITSAGFPSGWPEGKFPDTLFAKYEQWVGLHRPVVRYYEGFGTNRVKDSSEYSQPLFITPFFDTGYARNKFSSVFLMAQEDSLRIDGVPTRMDFRQCFDTLTLKPLIVRGRRGISGWHYNPFLYVDSFPYYPNTPDHYFGFKLDALARADFDTLLFLKPFSLEGPRFVTYANIVAPLRDTALVRLDGQPLPATGRMAHPRWQRFTDHRLPNGLDTGYAYLTLLLDTNRHDLTSPHGAGAILYCIREANYSYNQGYPRVFTNQGFVVQMPHAGLPETYRPTLYENGQRVGTPNVWVKHPHTFCQPTGSQTLALAGHMPANPFAAWRWVLPTGNGQTTTLTTDTFALAINNAWAPGIYTLRIEDANGCLPPDSVQFTLGQHPTVQLLATDVQSDCEHATVRLQASGTPATATLHWRTNAGPATGPDVTLPYPPDGADSLRYVLTVALTTNGLPCQDSLAGAVALTPRTVPEGWPGNAFSPNGDGLNDAFPALIPTPYAGCLRIEIVNRWGQPVYRSEVGTPWNGRTANADAAPGTYFYIIHAGERVLKGAVLLVR